MSVRLIVEWGYGIWIYFVIVDELVREYMKFEYSWFLRLKWIYKLYKVRVVLIIFI